MATLTNGATVHLLVEGESDAGLVRHLLEAAHYPADRIDVQPQGGKNRIKALAQSLPPPQVVRYAALIDLDERTVADAVARAREQLGNPPIRVFCAVPMLEAWLFADDALALEHARDDDARHVIRRLPYPEEIPYPKDVATRVFGSSWDFVRNANVERACARSPSLRAFLEGVGNMLGVQAPQVSDSVSRTISRDVFAGLIEEVLPAETILWRTSDGHTYTAAELCEHIRDGTETGRQYAADVLRVTRDLLARKARSAGA